MTKRIIVILKSNDSINEVQVIIVRDFDVESLDNKYLICAYFSIIDSQISLQQMSSR